MRRALFKTDEQYQRRRARDYQNRYVATQLYVARRWSQEDTDFLIKNGNHTLERELSEKLSRSIASIERKKNRLRKKGLMAYPNQNELMKIQSSIPELIKRGMQAKRDYKF